MKKDKEGILQQLLSLLEAKKINYYVIGGLVVNYYVEPVVILDLDIVVAAEETKELIKDVKKYLKFRNFIIVIISAVRNLTYVSNYELANVIKHLFLAPQ